MGGYPTRLIGELDTTENAGALRLLDFADEMVSSVIKLVQNTVINVVVRDFIVDKGLNTVVNTFTKYISFTNVAGNMSDIVKTLRGLITPDEIDYMIDNITYAMNTFITEDEVNLKIGNFSDSVDDISRSINNTMKSVDDCYINVQGNKIQYPEENCKPAAERLCFGLDDAIQFEGLVNVTHNLGKEFTTLLGYTTEEWGKWSDVKKCIGSTCDNNVLTEIAESIKIVNDLNPYSQDITILEGMVSNSDITTAFEKYLNAPTPAPRVLADVANDVAADAADSVFGNLSKSINASDFTTLSNNVLNINSSLYEMNTDALVDIISSINDTLNGLPSFKGIADALENVKNVTNIIPLFNVYICSVILNNK